MTDSEKNILTSTLLSISLIHESYWGRITIVIQDGKVKIVEKTETLK